MPDASTSSDGPESATTSATNPSRPADALPVGTAFRMALLLTTVGECYLVSRRDDLSLTGIDVLSPLEVVWDYQTGIARLPAQWGFYNSNNIAGQHDPPDPGPPARHRAVDACRLLGSGGSARAA